MRKWMIGLVALMMVLMMSVTGCELVIDEEDSEAVNQTTKAETTVQTEADEQTSEDVVEETYTYVYTEEDTEQIVDPSGWTEIYSTEETYEITYTFRKDKYLQEHFEKHGGEFTYTTPEEYLEGANRVIDNPEALTKTEKEDGDYIYYVESTNEFVIVSTDGYIRTYFKPSAGINYYNRQ